MNIRRKPPKNPLIRNGVSQGQRQVSALLPDFVKVDEGDLADFLVFAHQLSQQVNYYNDDNTKDGNWQEFFASSTPVQIALISKIRPETVKADYKVNLDNFLKSRAIDTLKPILATWYDVLRQIQQWYQGLEPDTSLKSMIRGLVQTNLREALKRMQSFAQIAQESSTTFYEFAQIFDLQINSQLEAAQILLQGTILEARAELDVVFQALFQNYRQIIQQAPKYLRDSLEKRQDHPPHLSLYFAFWEVMQPARDDLNRMTQRHLDFFYRHVLQLRDRLAEPDHTHLIFELAKSQAEYKLGADTRLLAGKDASGVELFYKLDAETVLHKAQIASLKGLFLDSQEIATGQEPKNILGLYHSPQVNSFDGEGGDFPKEQIVKAWLPFGNHTRKPSRFGLAIASQIFYLQEGTRTLIFTLTFDQVPVTLTASDLPNIFTVDFSGKKGWIAGEILPPETSKTNLVDKILELAVRLTAEQEPIDIYNPELPGAKLPTNQPIARLQLKNNVQISGLSAYNYFRNLQLTDLNISTEEIEVRNLVLQNDLAVLDSSKPFYPFGVRPKVKANLYIGSQEVFQKHLTALTIHLELEKPNPNWLDIYASYDSAYDVKKPNPFIFNPGKLAISSISCANASVSKKIWNSAKTNFNLFNSADITLTDELANLKLDSVAKTETVEAFTPDSQNGFLRLQLTESDFLHDEYPTVIARQVLAAATNQTISVPDPLLPKQPPTWVQRRQAIIGAYYKNNQSIFKVTYPKYYVEFTDEAIIPKEPYTPVIQEIYLKYTAVADQQDCQLFHLHPFDGFANWDEKKPYFLPQFTNEGELLIGLTNLDPPTALPLLFQVVEESADTNLPKAEVEWYYLQNNTWISLSDRIVSDFTNGLIASGIINLGIPENINKNNTILDPNLHWIKVSVKSGSGAICKIINVHTQAARVTFVDAGNDVNHLATPLPSGTIAKLAVSTSVVKKIEQPYNSFGGKVKEQPNHFYTRISEHLRHKGRAVTIFDYERLVLEKFPDINQVRCINHGQVDANKQFQEIVPGAVTLVVIPTLSQDRISQELEPKVNINLLEKIQEYLLSLSSPWADIQIVNPTYEHIQVEFAVKFKSPYDGNFGYYRRELQQRITNFLTPWTIDPQVEINFGGVVYRSSILNFVEQQYYVDYVVDFQMHHENQRDIQEAIALTVRSLLTSVSLTTTGQTHIINEASAIADNQKFFSGTLGYEALGNITLQPE